MNVRNIIIADIYTPAEYAASFKKETLFRKALFRLTCEITTVMDIMYIVEVLCGK